MTKELVEKLAESRGKVAMPAGLRTKPKLGDIDDETPAYDIAIGKYVIASVRQKTFAHAPERKVCFLLGPLENELATMEHDGKDEEGERERQRSVSLLRKFAGRFSEA